MKEEDCLERRAELARTLEERDRAGSELAQAVEQRNRMSSQLALAVAEREAAVAMKAESSQHVAAMQNTLLWRVAERLRRSPAGRVLRSLRPRR